MSNLKEMIGAAYLEDGVLFKENFETVVSQKLAERLVDEKKRVVSEMFNIPLKEEELDEGAKLSHVIRNRNTYGAAVGGAIAGAAVGGPVGAVGGAAIGALHGHAQDRIRRALSKHDRPKHERDRIDHENMKKKMDKVKPKD